MRDPHEIYDLRVKLLVVALLFVTWAVPGEPSLMARGLLFLFALSLYKGLLTFLCADALIEYGALVVILSLSLRWFVHLAWLVAERGQ